jgi:thimet oligopeptidase
MFDLRAGLEGEALPEAALVCNFSEPKDGDPALLLHQDVTTFFHEFGHLLHHLFAGRQRYLSFSGIATEWDFVEAPSQMYEEWAWDAGVLARFARHHKTGETIPAELVGRMRGAEEYGKGMHVAVQMFYAALSLALHDRSPEGLDPTAVQLELKREHLPFPHEPGSNFLAAFGHLNGYSAIYYTYMWSLVIAKDLFSRFDGDLMNSATANDYRQTILAPGGSRDAADLVRSFLGRDYATDAWETWLNS